MLERFLLSLVLSPIAPGGAAMPMTAEEYRAKARECERRAEKERDPSIKRQLLEEAEPSLHRRHSGQEAGRVGRAEEGGRHRGSQCLWPTALVEVERMACVETSIDRAAPTKDLNSRPVLRSCGSAGSCR
jgi:hypothetical protein